MGFKLVSNGVVSDPKSADFKTEKHVPVVSKTEKGIKVVVGSTPHPMTPEHWIIMIEVIYEGNSYKAFLKPGDKPEAEFPINNVNIVALEYCNIHGLWINQIANKSVEDLKVAFAGESQANRKYLAFAKQAEKDGLKQIAKVFRAAAEAETVHATNHLRTLGEIKTTVENVQAAANGEHYEFTKMYPAFIADAQKEANRGAERSFHAANEAEKVHHELYLKALEAANAKKDLPEKKIHVCAVCGMTFEGDAPDECPVCKAKKAMINEVK